MASTPFFTTFVSACAELAAVADHAELARRRVEREVDPGCATSCRNSAWRAISWTFSSRNTGLGMRAKLENSSTIRRRSPTWRTIVPVSRSNVSLSDAISLAEAPLQPLGGELDRGQRVLDLVRDAPRDVGPGRAPLVGKLVGDVVEGQHRAVLIAHALDRERALPGVGDDDHIRFGLLAAHELVELGRDGAQPLPFDLLLLCLQQRFGGAVESRIRLRESSAITPAVTLDSTASMKARRVSSWVLAARRALVCSSRRPAIRLNAVASVWISSSVFATGTRAEKSPSSIRPAA